MKHRDYVAEQMRDPRYRFWHYVYAPWNWLLSWWYRLRVRMTTERRGE